MDNNSESFDKILEYENRLHEKNQNRIKYGIRMIILIPLIFMFCMFSLESSKVVFLVLWIVSLFGIAAYLISVEYMDYQLQKKLSEFGIREDKPIEGLLKEESKVEQIIINAGLLDDDRESKLKALTQKRQKPVAEIEEKKAESDATNDKLDEILKAQKAIEEENKRLRQKLEEMEKASKEPEGEADSVEKTEAVKEAAQEDKAESAKAVEPQETVEMDFDADEEEEELPEEEIEKLHKQARVSFERVTAEEIELEDIIESAEDNVNDIEEELVESIRKYVHFLGKQAAQAPILDDPQRKSAQDYAAKRKAKALERKDHEKEKE